MLKTKYIPASTHSEPYLLEVYARRAFPQFVLCVLIPPQYNLHKMDLDDFQEQGRISDSPFKGCTPHEAVEYMDNVWYSELNRRSRWMDLVGDYAGNELFVLDGTYLLWPH